MREYLLSMLGLSLSLWPRGGGGGASISAEAAQFFDRLITLPDATRQGHYTTLIDGLVADGVWTRLDALVLTAASDSATALTNLVSNNLTPSLVASGGAPVFTADRGFLCAGINTCIGTTFVPSASGDNYSQDSALFGAWSRTTANTDSALWRNDAGTSVTLWPYYTGGFVIANSNSSDAVVTAGADSSGWFVTNRTASNAWTIKRNNSTLATRTDASAAPTSSVIKVGFGVYQIAAYAIGASLSSTQETALYNRVSTYMTAVGAA